MYNISFDKRLEDVKRFYEILEAQENKLGGKRTLANCNGHMGWPERGVYFFFEPGEYRSNSGAGMRVVRVGTHALTEKSKTTLWNCQSSHVNAPPFRGNTAPVIRGNDAPPCKRMQIVKVPFQK